MPNKDEIIAEMDQQYKKAFYSLFKKKFNAKLEKPDTLITDKKKFSKSAEKEVTKKTKWQIIKSYLTSFNFIPSGALI